MLTGTRRTVLMLAGCQALSMTGGSGQGVAIEDLAAVGEARLQPRDGVDRIGQRLAAIGPQLEGALEQPRLAGELGGDDLARGRPARHGVDCPPVLQKTQRRVVVRAPDEPRGRL